MGSVKPDPPFVTQHERARAWKMRALEVSLRRAKRRAVLAEAEAEEVPE